MKQDNVVAFFVLRGKKQFTILKKQIENSNNLVVQCSSFDLDKISSRQKYVLNIFECNSCTYYMHSMNCWKNLHVFNFLQEFS